jgi:116 kDa U5 small nuclear ribonucleoprotein component
VEKELIDVNNQKEVKTFLQSKYDWDILASSSIWSFGPEAYGTNALLNDSLATGTNQASLNRVKQSIVQGFRWSAR